jgi:hypothetical protein
VDVGPATSKVSSGAEAAISGRLLEALCAVDAEQKKVQSKAAS